MPPTKIWKTGKATVEGDPLTTIFHGQSSVVGIRDEIASSFQLAAKIGEDSPMVEPRRHDMNLFPGAKVLDEFQSGAKRSRLLEDFRMSYDSQATAESQVGDRYAGGLGKCPVHPRNQLGVALGVLAVRVYEHVHIQEDHRPSIASSRLAEEPRSTPGRTPDPLKVFRGRPGEDRADFGCAAREARSASSITSPIEQFR